MKSFWREYKIYLAIIAYLLSVGAVYFFAIKPLAARISEKNNKIQKILADGENNQEKISKIPILKEQFEKIKGEEDKIKVALTRGTVVNLIKKIETISEETVNKVKIEVAPDQVGKKTAAKSKKDEKKDLISNLPSDSYITISIAIEGDYASMLNFVQRLENMEYYCDIISFKVTKTEKKPPAFASNPFTGETADTEIKSIDSENNKITTTIIASFYLENK